MICLGDKVKTKDRLYLGVWIEKDTEGKVVGRKRMVTGQQLYFIQTHDDQVYTMASVEFEVIGRNEDGS